MPRYSTRKQQQQEQLENASSPGAEYVPSSSNDSTEDEFEQQQDESTQTHQQHSSSSSQQPMTSSILMISEQEALATDTYSKNGRSGKFNISAKNVPIKIRIASTVSLRSNPVSAELVYEQDGGVVLSPANQPHPLEWSLVIGNNEFTGVATCRILVLSTQHQGSLFQIKLTCQGQSVLSIPIRVISKRSHATRIVERQQRAAQQILGSEDSVATTTTIAQQTKPNNKRKRSQTFGANTKNKSSKHSEDYSEEEEDSEMTLDAPENEEYSPPVRPTQPTTIVIATAHAGKSVMVPTQQHSTASSSTSTTSSSNTNNEEVLKALNEIKAQQAMMMERMMLKQSTSTLSNPNAQQQTTIASSTSKTNTPSILDLESSFRALVRAYLDVPIEERASKMRKVAQESFENEQVAAELGQIWYGSHSLSSSGILEITTPQNTTTTTNTNTTKTNNTTSSNLSLSSSQFISERQTLTQSTMQLFDFTSLNSFIPQQQQLFSSNNLASVFGNNSNANNNIEFGVPLLSSSTGGQEFTSALQV